MANIPIPIQGAMKVVAKWMVMPSTGDLSVITSTGSPNATCIYSEIQRDRLRGGHTAHMSKPTGTAIAPVHIPCKRTSAGAFSPRLRARRRARNIIASVIGPEKSSPKVLEGLDHKLPGDVLEAGENVRSN